jgi:hypothetical protein
MMPGASAMTDNERAWYALSHGKRPTLKRSPAPGELVWSLRKGDQGRCLRAP